METGPPINMVHPPIQTRLPNPIWQTLQVWRARVNMDIVWLFCKLFLAVLIFSRNGTWSRTIFLASIAIFVFLFQIGAITIPQMTGQVHMNVQPQNPTPTAQPEAESQNAASMQNDTQPAAQQRPRTLLGIISWIAYSFFASMVPQNDIPQA